VYADAELLYWLDTLAIDLGITTPHAHRLTLRAAKQWPAGRTRVQELWQRELDAARRG
jgi:hypothetical protein